MDFQNETSEIHQTLATTYFWDGLLENQHFKVNTRKLIFNVVKFLIQLHLNSLGL